MATSRRSRAEKPAPTPAAEIKERALLSLVMPGRTPKPPRIFAYGTHGIGKSSWAADAPSPIFIPTEEGVNEIDVPKFPNANSHEEVMNYLRALYAEEHDYETVVIDTADWLEDFIRLELQKEHTDKELAYGRAELMLEERLSEVLGALNTLRNDRAMTSILLAHTEVKAFHSPMTESYDRYQPKLQPRFSALLQEWADAVLFMGYDINVIKEDAGFNKEKARGVGEGERRIWTEERPAFLAKNRYGMPPVLPMVNPAESKEHGDAFAEIAQWIPYLRESMKLEEPERKAA
jgi:hypothetical protein